MKANKNLCFLINCELYIFQCHRQDPSNANGMDLLAFLLWKQRKTMDLDRLTHRLTEINYNDNRQEAWIGN